MYSKQKSLNFGQYVPNDKVLNKKVPENPKYKHVKPAIDSGKSVRKHIDELKEKQKSNLYKKEVFKRIKFTTFLRLAIAVALEIINSEDIGNEDATKNASKENHDHENRKKTANVLMGIGELDVLNEKRKPAPHLIKPEKKLPYLLLDVRDRETFNKCHIITAKHYPAAMLSRTIGYENEDMKLYKNRLHELIIVYDDDEATAARVATTLVERGYNNVFLLSGGLKLGLEICPQGLTTSAPAKLTSDYLHNSRQSKTPDIQKTIPKEYFSQEDVDIIQQCIDNCHKKDNDSIWSSSRSRSYGTSSKDKSRHSYSRVTCSGSSCPKYPFPSSRSSNSSKPTEQSLLQLSNRTNNCRLKTTKKAPWK